GGNRGAPSPSSECIPDLSSPAEWRCGRANLVSQMVFLSGFGFRVLFDRWSVLDCRNPGIQLVFSRRGIGLFCNRLQAWTIGGEDKSSRAREATMKTLFEGPSLLVIDKPAGLPVLPDGWEPDAPFLVKILEETY